MDWNEYLLQLDATKGQKTATSALWLQAVADITNHCLLVVTSVESQRYLLNIEPSEGEGEGLVVLAHWGFSSWAPLQVSNGGEERGKRDV